LLDKVLRSSSGEREAAYLHVVAKKARDNPALRSE
jgi:hypothetical protein